MGVPTTASRAALDLAPGVPDLHEPLDQWLTRYDEAVPAHLRLLAIVLSPTFDATIFPRTT